MRRTLRSTLRSTLPDRRSAGLFGLAFVGWLCPVVASAELSPLRTAAALSARPEPCAPRSPEGASVWSGVRAARTTRSRLCAQMAQVGRLLLTDPANAARLLEHSVAGVQVGQSWRGPAGLEVPFRLLQARVALALGHADTAFQLFHRSAAQLPISGWDPHALRDYAISAVAAAQYGDAVAIYRRLVAVSAWLDDSARVSVSIEAAVAVLRLPEPDTLEALGYLTALAARDSDPLIARLGSALQTLARSFATGVVEPTEVEISPKGLRGLARLSEHDWHLIESWIAWRYARDASLWAWAREAAVPDSYRRFAGKLTSGG